MLTQIKSSIDFYFGLEALTKNFKDNDQQTFQQNGY